LEQAQSQTGIMGAKFIYLFIIFNGIGPSFSEILKAEALNIFFISLTLAERVRLCCC
jgi:hypothetical membrane protein